MGNPAAVEIEAVAFDIGQQGKVLRAAVAVNEVADADVFARQDQRVVAQFAPGELRWRWGVCKPGRGGDESKRFGREDRVLFQPGRRCFGDGKLDVETAQVFDQPFMHGFVDAHADVRVLFAPGVKVVHDGGKQAAVFVHAGQDADVQFAFFAAAAFGDLRAEVVKGDGNAFAKCVQQFACGAESQLASAFFAQEEFLAEAVFELAHQFAQRWLGDAEAVGGAAEAFVFGKGGKIAPLARADALTPGAQADVFGVKAVDVVVAEGGKRRMFALQQAVQAAAPCLREGFAVVRGAQGFGQ